MRTSGVWLASLLVASAAMFPVCANAAHWEFNPRISLSSTYDDNYRLSNIPGQMGSVYGGNIDAQLQIQAQSPTTTLQFVPRLWSSYYPGHSEDAANDQFALLDLTHNGLRSQSALRVDFRRQTLLKESLFSASGNAALGQPSVGTDVGTLLSRDRRNLLLADPTVRLFLSPRQRLVLAGQYLDITYEQQLPGQYNNYQNMQGTVGLEFNVSPQSTVALRAIGSDFKPRQGADSNTYGIQAQWTRQITQTATYYLRGGFNRTEFKADAASRLPARAADSVAGGAGVTWAFQVTNVFLDALRTVSPNAGGFAGVEDQLRFRVEHRITPRLADFAGIAGIRDSTLGGEGNAFSDRQYLTGTVGLEWRLARVLSLASTYSYTWQRYVNRGPRVQSNAVSISLIYEPHRPEQGPPVTVRY